MSPPLQVALLWHMHQPLYRDDRSGDYLLPRVRLHAAKDYLHMASLVAEFPELRVTFNLVPSLLEQLDDCARGEARDPYLRVSLTPAKQLSDADRRFMLDHFFDLNWDRVIRRYPRYGELLEKREQSGRDPAAFQAGDWRDLQVWHNLAWIDPDYVRAQADLHALVERGGGFGADDARQVTEAQRQIAAAVVPAYRLLLESGQAELTTSPYFHPILPLLIDTDSVRRELPDLPLPARPFRHPEDAREQIRLAIAAHARRFGRPPAGMWPSEGAISPETLAVAAAAGVRWLAADEAVLARGLQTRIDRDGAGQVLEPDVLYRPYQAGLELVPAGSGPLELVFRDRVLSDRIGFEYAGWGSIDAADDLVQRLDQIRARLGETDQAHLVTIALDGENCWEHYEDNGNPFLRRLYARLSEDPSRLRTTTIAEFLGQHAPARSLSGVGTGSWVNGTLDTWIGQPEQNAAWALLAEARAALAETEAGGGIPTDGLERARRQMFVAEGSDWFWWYNQHHDSGEDEVFDRAFRFHLAAVYRGLGRTPPAATERPISSESSYVASRPVGGPISPSLEASAEPTAGWASAGYQDPAGFGSMHRGEVVLRRLYFGSNAENLYFRIEANEALAPYLISLQFCAVSESVGSQGPRYAEPGAAARTDLRFTHELAYTPSTAAITLVRAVGQDAWLARNQVFTLAQGERVAELAVPLAKLDLRPGELVALVAAVVRQGAIIETLPETGAITFTLAT